MDDTPDLSGLRIEDTQKNKTEQRPIPQLIYSGKFIKI